MVNVVVAIAKEICVGSCVGRLVLPVWRAVGEDVVEPTINFEGGVDDF
jgi:hypothetical protein